MHASELSHAHSAPPSRRLFIGQSLVAGAGLAGFAGIVGRADAAPPNTPSQTEFFQWTRRNFRNLRRHENDHVDFLLTALGIDARPKPTFVDLEQPNYAKFAKVAQALENTGVGAYLGAAPKILDAGILAAAGSIALIEARHAGWLNTLRGMGVTDGAMNGDENQSFDRAFTAAEVVTLAGPFMVDLNGGSPLDYSDTPSTGNDVDILNFALALEYLEAEYYDINVPKFFPGA